MNPEEPSILNRRERLLAGIAIWLWGVPVAVVLLLLLYYIFSGSPRSSGSARSFTTTKENNLDSVRQTLSRQTDLASCRSALQQLNTEMGGPSSLSLPTLPNEQKNWLRSNLRLSDDECSEIETNSFTRLDDHHLFRCFLMRDIIDALDVKGVRDKAGTPVQEKPLARAARAFAWTMREVRLLEVKGETAPPSYVVRRGNGTALERALVFLALLEQIGDPQAPQPEVLGFLLQLPDATGGHRLWACGVVVGEAKEVYLFDPHLGLPLPGPNGEGIATLEQVCKRPEILAQLNLDDKHRYPVTQEQVRTAQAQVVCPLSSLAPRLRYLQNEVLAPTVRVRLASDALHDFQRVQAACAAGLDKPLAVSAARDESTLLRRFLPVEEGGTDTQLREQQFRFALVPWRAMPPEFLDERRFSTKVGLGLRVRQVFAVPFLSTTMDTGMARDQLLRGQYSSAVPTLVDERMRWRNLRQQAARSTNLVAEANKWLGNATRAYAMQVRAKTPQERAAAESEIQAVWDTKQAGPIYVILHAAAAAAREPETAYQLGLCSQEQAEQLQARLDLLATVGTAAEKSEQEKAAAAWRKARSDWQRFEESYPDHPDLLAVRRMRGRAASLLGDSRDAIAVWKKIPASADALESLASLYLALHSRSHAPRGNARPDALRPERAMDH